jgi:hypothetical protein
VERDQLLGVELDHQQPRVLVTLETGARTHRERLSKRGPIGGLAMIVDVLNK